MFKRKKRKWCHPGSNQGPFIPQTDVFTTRPSFHWLMIGKNFNWSMFLVFVAKSEDLCWIFCNFSDFQIGKTQSSQEFSTWDLDNSIFIVVYFKGYFSRVCTFLHFPEIFNFVQFSQHICHFAEFLSSFMKRKIDNPNLYAKRQLFIFMQKVCKLTLQVINRGFKLL